MTFNPSLSNPMPPISHFSKDFFIINKQTEEVIIKAQFSSLYFNNKLEEDFITYNHSTYSPSYYPSLYSDSYKNIQYFIELSHLIFLNNEIEKEKEEKVKKKVGEEKIGKVEKVLIEAEAEAEAKREKQSKPTELPEINKYKNLLSNTNELYCIGQIMDSFKYLITDFDIVDIDFINNRMTLKYHKIIKLTIKDNVKEFEEIIL